MSRSGLIGRILHVYLEQGLPGVVKRALRKRRPAPRGEAYQVKLQTAFDDRWQLISSQIDADCYSLLDIGCNLGAFTARAATSGLWALGIEMSRDLVARAHQSHAGVENCGFMQGKLDPESSARIPRFDVILILSVHHHWHQAFGPAAAAEMLRNVIGRANRVVIFEGPSRVGRYLRDLPDFADNEEASVVGYYDGYLKQTVGDLVSEIRLLGKTACVGDREPYRWMYSLIL